MKPPIIALSILGAVLAVLLYLQHNKTRDAFQTGAQQSQLASNEISQIRLKLFEAESQAARNQSNLQFLLDRRTAGLVTASNRVVQLNGSLAEAHAETQRAVAANQTSIERISALEGQSDELRRQVASLQPLEARLANARERVRLIEGDLQTVLKEVERLQLEKAELQRQMGDLDFLRLQAAKVESEIAVRRRLAGAAPGAPPDLRRPLVMLDDGSVRLALPTNMTNTAARN